MSTFGHQLGDHSDCSIGVEALVEPFYFVLQIDKLVPCQVSLNDQNLDLDNFT